MYNVQHTYECFLFAQLMYKCQPIFFEIVSSNETIKTMKMITIYHLIDEESAGAIGAAATAVAYP